MSIVAARRKRAALYFSIVGLLLLMAAVSAVSARDASGVWVRIGMVMMTVGAAMWLPWQALLPAAFFIWLGPNWLRASMDDLGLFETNMLLELPGIIGIIVFAYLARFSLRTLEEEDVRLGTADANRFGIDEETGVYEERLLRSAIEAELARARRFGREFAIVLVGADELTMRFDYDSEDARQAAVLATAQVLRSRRAFVDRAYRHGPAGFALLLPESGPREVTGLIRRLRRVARQASPPEGERGGPFPTVFGATFFPQSATTVDGLLRRAEIALRLAEKSPNRMQLDGAEAPPMPAPELLRSENGAVPEGKETLIPESPSPGVEQPLPAVKLEAGEAQTEETSLEEMIRGLQQHLAETLGFIQTLKSGPAS